MYIVKILISSFLIFFLVFALPVMNDYVNGEDGGGEHKVTESDATEEQSYFCQFIFSNLDTLAEKRDLITIYDEDGNMYDAYYIYSNEKNHVFNVRVNDFVVSSDLLGKIEVHCEGPGRVYVYVDYLNKTVTYEQLQQDEKGTVNNLESYGYSIANITDYGKLIVKGMLKDNGFTDYYTNEENERHYNYTAEDYKSMPNFDERYLYSLYLVVDDYTIDEFTKSLGYEDLEDYLIKNDYVDEEGNPSTYNWYNVYLYNMAKIMNELPEEEESAK